jgi:hypothetical protein
MSDVLLNFDFSVILFSPLLANNGFHVYVEFYGAPTAAAVVVLGEVLTA